jgi:N-acyl-D-aspartate/D-glutamate deacylase
LSERRHDDLETALSRPVVGFLVVFFAFSAAAPNSGLAQPADYDILIRDGQVIDGTGSPAEKADIGIRGDKIVAIGELSASADRMVDADGLVVAPGFIDVHNHSAPALADSAKRLNEGFLRQGVTTIVGGPDGKFSPGIIRSLIDAYDQHGIGTNVALYVGHNAVRIRAMSQMERPLTIEDLRFDKATSEGQQRRPTAEEMEQMRALVREGMELGAVGFSTGLMYPPGMYSETDEVVQLAQEATPYSGIYTSHVRSPAQRWLESNREAIEIGERAAVPVKLTHLKAVGLQNASKVDSLITMVEATRERGVEVVSDQYPYDGAMTTALNDIIAVPDSLAQKEGFKLEQALDSGPLRSAMKNATEHPKNGNFTWVTTLGGYGSMRIVSSPHSRELEGRYIVRLAEERGTSPFDLVADLVARADRPIRITLGAIQEEDVRALLDEPWNMIASDGSWADGSDGQKGHPRSTGTFPRLLGHYVREEGVLSLEEAVRKITSFPADFLGLADRGRLQEGAVADVVVFDPDRIAARSTWQYPQRFAKGVRHVLVNGVWAISDGQLTGKTPGQYVPRTKGATGSN